MLAALTVHSALEAESTAAVPPPVLEVRDPSRPWWQRLFGWRA
jgi:hypothetical protein